MTEKGCPFCTIENPVFENSLAFVIPDKYPVRPGHSLVIPKRHVPSFFDLSGDELAACFDLIKAVREDIDGKHAPGGYKIGINVGRPSGQTVMHVHIHVVPVGEEPIRGRSEVFVRKDF